MKEIRISMGMPAMVEIVDAHARAGIDAVFAYFTEVDERFSPYRADSEVSRLNAGTLLPADIHPDFKEVLALAEKTRRETKGFFNVVRPDGFLDPSGVVKGLALERARELLLGLGYSNFCIDIGGDVAVAGVNGEGRSWSVGIRSPFSHGEIVKVVYPEGRGMATSGSSARGNHIYDPHDPARALREVMSITVLGPSILAADLLATAAFAMGRQGIEFIETHPGFEAYSIDADGIATMTSGFSALTLA